MNSNQFIHDGHQCLSIKERYIEKNHHNQCFVNFGIIGITNNLVQIETCCSVGSQFSPAPRVPSKYVHYHLLQIYKMEDAEKVIMRMRGEEKERMRMREEEEKVRMREEEEKVRRRDRDAAVASGMETGGGARITGGDVLITGGATVIIAAMTYGILKFFKS